MSTQRIIPCVIKQNGGLAPKVQKPQGIYITANKNLLQLS